MSIFGRSFFSIAARADLKYSASDAFSTSVAGSGEGNGTEASVEYSLPMMRLYGFEANSVEKFEKNADSRFSYIAELTSDQTIFE